MTEVKPSRRSSLNKTSEMTLFLSGTEFTLTLESTGDLLFSAKFTKFASK